MCGKDRVTEHGADETGAKDTQVMTPEDDTGLGGLLFSFLSFGPLETSYPMVKLSTHHTIA